jgi:hypothetical protein
VQAGVLCVTRRAGAGRKAPLDAMLAGIISIEPQL